MENILIRNPYYDLPHITFLDKDFVDANPKSYGQSLLNNKKKRKRK